MSLLKAYLQNPRTRRVLSRKPGQKGFSLIELVVVIAVLAVLTAIALPNFLGVSDDAAARSAQQAVVTAFKECQVKKARGETNGGFEQADLSDFIITSTDDTTPVGLKLPGYTAAQGTTAGNSGARVNDCFNTSGGLKNFASIPKVEGKFPIFFVAQSGIKTCANGTESGNENTWNVGCLETTAGSGGEWR